MTWRGHSCLPRRDSSRRALPRPARDKQRYSRYCWISGNSNSLISARSRSSFRTSVTPESCKRAGVLAPQLPPDRPRAFVSHAERILHDDRVDRARAQICQECLRRIHHHQFDVLRATRLNGLQRAFGTRLVVGVDPRQIGMRGEQVLGNRHRLGAVRHAELHARQSRFRQYPVSPVNPSSRCMVDALPGMNPTTPTLPLPPRISPMRRAAIRPASRLLVAT